MTTDKQIVNEKWLISILKGINIGGFWMWSDYAEMYYVNDKRQFITKNQKQFNLISKIVRPTFMTIFVVKDF